MTKRSLLLLWFMALVVGFGGLFVWARNIPTTRSPINRSTYDRISKGMTLKEVEDLIGMPPGGYPPGWRPIRYLDDFYFKPDRLYVHWYSNDYHIIISLTMNEIVIDKRCYPEPTETFWQKLQRWFTPW